MSAMSRFHPLLAASLVFSLLPSLADAQQWTRFRGPNGSGIAQTANIPLQWTETDYNWKIQLPGKGHSSPVLWGDRVFLTSCDTETAKRILLCLNTADGSLRWKREFPSKTYRQHGDNSYASSSPALDDRHVYVAWTTPDEYTLRALDHDGKDVWQISLGRYTSQHGSGASPIVFQDLVILTNDQEGPESYILAVDRLTGQTRWKSPRRSTSMAASTPCIYMPPGKPPQLILTSRTEGVTALDPLTGTLIWQAPDAFAWRVIASPVVADGLIIGHCGEGPNGKGLVAVRPPATGDKAEVAWKMVNRSPYVPTSLAKGDLLFTLADSGTLSCLRAATGQVLWQERIGGSYYSSPICIGDHLYCISKKGEVLIFSATEKYELLARNPLPELCYATPAVADGRLYIRTLSHLVSIGK